MLVGLALAEVGLRLAAERTHRVRGLRFDPLLGWRPLPNVVRWGADWSADEAARTNSDGWRDAEFTRAAEGRARIVAIGDSFTWGAGVDYGERWTEFLENEGARRDVLNLGVNAFGSDQEMLLLEHDGLRYEPDAVVVMLFLGNDSSDIYYERHFDWPKPYCVPVAGGLRVVAPVKTWDVTLRESSYLGELAFRGIGRCLERNVRASALEHVDPVELLVAIVARMHTSCAAAEVPMICVLVYPKERAVEPPQERELAIAATLRARGVSLVDLHAVFARGVATGAKLFLSDGHWTPEGHALAGSEIERALAALGF